MKVWKKFVSVLSFTLCFAVFLAGNCYAADMAGEEAAEPRAPTYYSLNVPNIQQKYENSCWATCGASVCGYYGYSITQETFAQKAGRDVTNTGSFSDVKKGLSAYGIGASAEYSGIISFSRVKQEIYAGRPILINSMRHLMVLDGYEEISGGAISFMDPAKGRHDGVAYEYIGIYDEIFNPDGYGLTDYMFILA